MKVGGQLDSNYDTWRKFNSSFKLENIQRDINILRWQRYGHILERISNGTSFKDSNISGLIYIKNNEISLVNLIKNKYLIPFLFCEFLIKKISQIFKWVVIKSFFIVSLAESQNINQKRGLKSFHMMSIFSSLFIFGWSWDLVFDYSSLILMSH